MEKEKTMISCLSDYLKVIESLKADYPTNSICNNPTQTHFLYRGISDENYKLIPSVFRKQEDTPNPENPERKIENQSYLPFANEKTILQSFRQGRKCCVKEGNPTVKKRWISRVRGKPE